MITTTDGFYLLIYSKWNYDHINWLITLTSGYRKRLSLYLKKQNEGLKVYVHAFTSSQLHAFVQDSRLLAINGGTELLLYGGRVSADIDAIWKYTVADNTWKQVRKRSLKNP